MRNISFPVMIVLFPLAMGAGCSMQTGDAKSKTVPQAMEGGQTLPDFIPLWPVASRDGQGDAEHEGKKRFLVVERRTETNETAVWRDGLS